MTDESEQVTERTQAAARAARRARRIGGRSTPDAVAEGTAAQDTAAQDTGATDTAVGSTAGATTAASGRAADAGVGSTAGATTAASGRESQQAAVPLTKRAGGEPVPDGTAAPDTTAAPGTPDATPAWSGRRAWLPAFVLAIVCLGFLGWGIYDSHGVWWAKSSSSVAHERGPVLAAAKSCMAAMNTYDYRKLAESEAKGVACTTGTFTGQYKQAFEKLIKPQAAKVQFTQTAQINNAGIESVSGDGQQWVVLVYGQLSTTNSQTGTKAPTLTPFSARVTMQHAGDKWLVANYQYAPTS